MSMEVSSMRSQTYFDAGTRICCLAGGKCLPPFELCWAHLLHSPRPLKPP